MDEKASLVGPSYENLMKNLEKNDNDLDVKVNSIVSMGFLMKACHTKMTQAQIDKVMDIYQQRVSIQGTRESTLKAYIQLATNDTVIKL
jgi:hypothetical protein